MSLQGVPEIRRRLKAIKLITAPSGVDSTNQRWAKFAVEEAKRRVRPYRRTGATERSIRIKSSSQRRATVIGNYPVNFIDAGAKAHDIFSGKRPTKHRKGAKNLAFAIGGQSIFRKKVHKRQQAAHPFKQASAEAALRDLSLANRVVDLWNRAA